MERGACGNICSPSESELRSVVCTRQLTRHATRQRSAYHVSVPTRYGNETDTWRYATFPTPGQRGSAHWSCLQALPEPAMANGTRSRRTSACSSISIN